MCTDSERWWTNGIKYIAMTTTHMKNISSNMPLIRYKQKHSLARSTINKIYELHILLTKKWAICKITPTLQEHNQLRIFERYGIW